MYQSKSQPQTIVPMAVTGMGVYSPLGSTLEEFWQRIDNGECAVKEIQGFNTGDLRVKHAAEIASHDPGAVFEDPNERQLDWTAQFGILAARKALEDAQVDTDLLHSERFGLVVGVCAGGQGLSPKQRKAEDPFDIALDKFADNSLYRQTDAIGKSLKIHGVRSTVSTACASSGSALAYAFDLLQSKKADAILVGGTDAFSVSTYAGFYALGAMPEQPISPFSENTGVSFGEGAGFVVLEPLAAAEARGAKIYGVMLGYGCTGDAHHVTAPHPSGDGLHRAMKLALDKAGLSPEKINYINAHGTATRDNDRAESSAIREVFKDEAVIPPVSSSKSQFGHTLGAAGVLEFIVCILAQQAGRIPPTVNYVSARPGCDLDYVPNHSREGVIDTFLSNSAAFGGINVSVLGGSLAHRERIQTLETDEIWITGAGLVSPVGCGIDDYRQALIEGRSGITLVKEFDVADCGARHAGLMGDFKARKLAPTVDVRRTDPLNRYAMVAAALALKHSKLEVRAANSSRVGMAMCLNYGSLAVQLRFRDSLRADGVEGLSAKHFPSMVVSTVGGTVAQSFNFRGFNSTIADGITGGLQGLIHGYLTMQMNPWMDAIVVVATDEVAEFLFRSFDQQGLLAKTGNEEIATLAAYSRQSRGMLLGEGAVALVLERAKVARDRGATPLGKVCGVGMTSDSMLSPVEADSWGWHAASVHAALRDASIDANKVDLIYGHGRGELRHDQRELKSLSTVFGDASIPLANVLGNTGVAAATSGLYSVVAALLSLQHQEAYPVIGTSGDLIESNLSLVQSHCSGSFERILVTGSTENGNHSSIVIGKVEG